MSLVAENKFLAAMEAHRLELRRFGVRQIGLFGSCLRGDETPKSDVDLLVEFEAGRKTLANLVDLGDFLEVLFHRRVELITREALSPYIGPHILNEVHYAALAA